jgi:hypothetical protein
VIDALLAAGADPDARTPSGLTPFILAVAHGQLPAAVALEGVSGLEIEGGAGQSRAPTPAPVGNPSAADVAALHRAAEAGDLLALGRLVQLVGPNAADGEGVTALHHAASAGQVAAIGALLAAGADANARNCKGSTPLLWAASDGQAEAIERLLAGGADVNAAMENGVTPLHWVSIMSHMARTPVSYASAYGFHGLTAGSPEVPCSSCCRLLSQRAEKPRTLPESLRRAAANAHTAMLSSRWPRCCHKWCLPPIPCRPPRRVTWQP